MTMFTVRIELHGATWDHYKALYERLAAKGFLDTITADNGAIYKMPGGEYNWEGNATMDQVLDAAKTSAAATVPKYDVLVTQSAGRVWSV